MPPQPTLPGTNFCALLPGMLAGNRCYAVLQDPNGYVMFAVHYGGALPTNPQIFTPGCIMIKPDVPTGRILVNTGTLAVPSWGAVAGTLGGLVADPSQVPPPPPPEMVAAMREKSAADHKLPPPPSGKEPVMPEQIIAPSKEPVEPPAGTPTEKNPASHPSPDKPGTHPATPPPADPKKK